MIDLYRIKEDFSVLVKEAEPWTLTQFVMWLDLKLSEYKIKGYMVLDHHTKTKPKWIAEEDNTSDVAPVTFRQSKKPTNDGNFYSDLQASPSTHRNVLREQHQPMDDSDAVRGDVGIIDLSHAENNRRNNTSNMSRPRHSDISLSKNYQSSAFQEKSSNAMIERDKSRKDDIIEIDASSPTEKMFVTSNKTSTPIQHVQAVQKPKNRPALSMGTAIYTSTSSTTTPTFSTSYISPTSRSTVSTFSGRKYALGAPPLSVTVPSNMASLDDMIAQAVQFNEINTDIPSQSHSRQISSHTDVQQPPPPKISDVEKHPVQSSFTKQHPVQTNTSEQVNVFPQTSTQSSAVPVALHANIDNINRDISQSSTHSSTEALEIKVETEVDNSITDSFFIGSFGDEPESPDVGDGLSDKDDQPYLPQGPACTPLRYGKEIELPTFEDPLVRRALEDNKPPSRHTWSKIITRCAYHLLSKGVPRKHDYQMFAESFYRRYPCVGTSRGPNPWSGLAHSISASIRNLRWNARKKVRAQQSQSFT